ncbi:MAG: FKBP-type peptidyl-prolyl cis-trans isomerase [Prevotellaceae bacterium]|jgi:FKBP-type peptidyl-prolyl cis-trans isomerase|nr:FKBP-type peptidyl-prolyl cis-trans isomerase [Prevotellaceae bacterium]
MKQILILSVATLFFVTTSCAQNNNKDKNNDKNTSATSQENSAVQTASYAFGVDVASTLKNYNIEGFDVEKFNEGFKNSYNDDGKIDYQANRQILQDFMTALQTQKSEKNINEGKEFLEKNAKENGVITTESGLQYKIIEEGTGNYPTADDKVLAHYAGTLIDGREFDSSYKNNENKPLEFPLSGVIAGWKEGIPKVKEGGKIKLFVPYNLAYGERAVPGTIIEGYSTLIFEVELIKIVK